MSLRGEGFMILGTFRSGTSSLAAMLAHFGVYFGEEQALYGANEHNPGGHFELHDLIALDDNIFDSFGMKYYSGGGLPENWKALPPTPAILPAVRGLLTKHFSGHPLFAFKEPDATGLVPVFQAALANDSVSLRFPICIRHPLSVISSMRKRMGTPEKLSSGNAPHDHSRIDLRMMGVWMYYTLASLKDTQGQRRQIFAYENLIQRPREYIERLASLIDAPVTEEQLVAGAATIQPQLSHSQYGMADLEGWPEIVSRTYALCLRADADPDGFAGGAFDDEIDALWEEWRRERLIFRPALPPHASVSVSWTRLDRPGQASEELSPDGGWSSISLPFESSPLPRVVINPFPSPCQVWIRKAMWRIGRSEQRAPLRVGPNGRLQQVYGLGMLTVLGPDPLVVDAPKFDGPVTLELEILVQADRDVLTNLIPVLLRELQ